MTTPTTGADLNANWNYPTRIWFGPGRLSELAAACREIGIARPLIVCDPHFSGLPVMTGIREDLARAGIAADLFDRLQGNPTSRNLADGIAAFRAGRHDGVIAFGGGSALDVGKTVALMVAQDRPVWDFEDIGDHWRRARTDGIAPVIAVPTTSGTGSEVGRATVITNDETHEKKIIFHPMMMPRLVIADPALTTALPPALTAGTGMDALAHCLEAYSAPGFHPMADAIAVEGIRLLHDFLPRAFDDAGDLEARARVMAAASMGGTAFQKGLGAIHALSHPIGAIHGVHHGLTNAELMPYVVDFNRAAIGAKMDHLVRCMGLPDGAGGASSVDRFIGWTIALRRHLAIPHTLAELGIDPAGFGRIAEMSLRDPTAGTNPVPLTLEASLGILDAAFSGTVRTG
jgi:alcohol dehydrogenase